MSEPGSLEVVLTALPGALPALRRDIARVGLTPSTSGSAVPAEPGDDDDELRLLLTRTPETVRSLSGLRTAVAAWLVVSAPTPRPTGLVASEALVGLEQALEAIAWQRPRVRFSGLRLEAAGSGTPQMQRLAAEYAERAGVLVAEDGDLVVRVRRSPARGWEALVRTSPRPLATRPWRTERYPGALNATLAAAVADELTHHRERLLWHGERVLWHGERVLWHGERVLGDVPPVVVDLMCGSGTLTLETLARGPVARMISVDVSPEALAILGRHQRASRIKGRIDAVCADVADIARPGAPLSDLTGAADVIMANPPWGELLGEHETNERLYRDVLDAADRLGVEGVVVGILTHDIRRLERILSADVRWRILARPQFFAKGHRPRLFVLARAGAENGAPT